MSKFTEGPSSFVNTSNQEFVEFEHEDSLGKNNVRESFPSKAQLLEEEKKFLDKFRSKKGNITSAFLLVSTLLMASDLRDNSIANELLLNKSTHEQNDIKANSAHNWANSIALQAKREVHTLRKPVDKEDQEFRHMEADLHWFNATYLSRFLDKYYDEGWIDASHHVVLPNYTEEEARSVLKSAQELKALGIYLSEKYNTEEFLSNLERLTELIWEVKDYCSYVSSISKK